MCLWGQFTPSQREEKCLSGWCVLGKISLKDVTVDWVNCGTVAAVVLDCDHTALLVEGKTFYFTYFSLNTSFVYLH